MKVQSWQTILKEDVVKNFNSDLDNGLSKTEVKLRLEKYGKNELPLKKEDGFIKLFLMQFKDSIVLVMLVASLFSFIIGEAIDALVIIFIILLDAIMGTVQEWNAHKNANSLKQMIKTMTIVLRDGKEEEIDAVDIVPGDIVLLQSGNRIPADMRLVDAQNLTVDESSLTGESIASIKHENIIKESLPIADQDNMAFAGSNVVTGRGIGIVVNTGINTEIGKIASEVSKADEAKSPLTIRVDKFSKQITLMIVILAVFLIGVLYFKDYVMEEILLTVIALTAAAMPEGLPLALTLALTIGSNRMAKRNIIVKKMSAVESLGSTTVIASDKTGTLTVNEQTAKKIVLPNYDTFEVTGTGYNDDGVIKNINSEVSALVKYGVLNNEAHIEKEAEEWICHGDSIDIAFLCLGKKAKTSIKDILIQGSIPYESENKYSAVFYKENSKNYVTVKGSIDTILDFCDVMIVDGKRVKLKRNQLLKQNEQLAKYGYRVIALANVETKKLKEKDNYNKEDLPKMEFVGLVAFIDPIRKEVADAIKEVTRSGIKVVMITGDHPLTAYSIASELRIASSLDNVATSEELDKYLNLSQKKFDQFIKDKTVFTRVTPLQKLEIVNAYKRMGEFVAVTGDGVNDAPALKVANIGIAMGSGTDVAKETSTMIITDDNFKSIVAGVEEGRVAYSNIRKVVYMLISCGLGEVLFFVLSIIMGLPMPLLAIQLLWLNVVTDGFQDMALSFEKKEESIMLDKPRNPKSSLFDRKLIEEVILAGLFIGIIVFGVWIYLIKGINMPVEMARGYVMVLMIFMQNIHVLNCRSEKNSIFKSKWNNPLVFISITSAILLQVIIMKVPFLAGFMQVASIPFRDLIILFLCALPVLALMEIYKKLSKGE